MWRRLLIGLLVALLPCKWALWHQALVLQKNSGAHYSGSMTGWTSSNNISMPTGATIIP